MTRLFQRSWSATIGTTQITNSPDGRELTLKFSVTKSTEREPNTCQIRIANLSESRRRQLEQHENPQVELRAGYEDLEDLIFAGDVRDLWSTRQDADVWTTIEAEDGGRSYRTAEYEASFGPDTPVQTVLNGIANAMGVGLGNATSVIAGAELDSGSLLPGGIVISGPAWRSLDRLCRSCSLRWSIQSGVLQLRQQSRAATTRAILLTSSNGMIGSPTRGKRDERTDRIPYHVRSLIVPGIYPGRVIRIESSEVDGDFLCRRVQFTGDTSGSEWYADIEIEEYDS